MKQAEPESGKAAAECEASSSQNLQAADVSLGYTADQVPQTKGDEQQEAVATRQDSAPHLWRPPQPQGGQGPHCQGIPD